MDDLDEFASWHKDLNEWERFQYELERISGEKKIITKYVILTIKH
ncbi:hypothetical protein [Bacteroides congonensis]|jgi:hypothetical protein|nr:hypothetical protein [Bacteroides congonensis]